MRKPFICGNWKLNLRQVEALALVNELTVQNDVDVAVAPVATLLQSVGEALVGSRISLAAQNVYWEAQGAFTGEWSVGHLTELGCQYCIVGHSERRQLFGDTNDNVAKKVLACLNGALTPIVCVGETLLQRESGQTSQVLTEQLTPVLEMLSSELVGKIIIAYEPVWAIGTGRAATSTQAQEVHAFIRDLLGKRFAPQRANEVRIIYGGSVNAANIVELMKQPDIDGALVGGASLLADSFGEILRLVV